jgi:hypothetical protein
MRLCAVASLRYTVSRVTAKPYAPDSRYHPNFEADFECMCEPTNCAQLHGVTFGCDANDCAVIYGTDTEIRLMEDDNSVPHLNMQDTVSIASLPSAAENQIVSVLAVVKEVGYECKGLEAQQQTHRRLFPAADRSPQSPQSEGRRACGASRSATHRTKAFS